MKPVVFYRKNDKSLRIFANGGSFADIKLFYDCVNDFIKKEEDSIKLPLSIVNNITINEVHVIISILFIIFPPIILLSLILDLNHYYFELLTYKYI